MIYVGASPSSLQAISPDPSAFEWNNHDVSGPEAGRVKDTSATMYKERWNEKRKIKLTWQNITFQQAHVILQAFEPEYFYMKYMDPQDGGWVTRCFYRGDTSAPYRWFNILGGSRMSQVSFDIIER